MSVLEQHTRLTLFHLRHGSPARARLSSAITTTEKKTKLRILALHGYGQSSESFRKKSGSLRKQVKSLADFHFVDALIKAPARVDSLNRDIDEDGGLGWWIWNADEEKVFGWRESVTHVCEEIQKHGPFDGVLGFSQGASLAALALHELCKRMAGDIRFVCLVGGFIPRNEEQARILKDHAPYLNIDVWTSFGMSDQIIPWEKSLELHRMLIGPEGDDDVSSRNVIVRHAGGHLVSSEKATRASFKDFLRMQLHSKTEIVQQGASAII